MAQRKAWLLEQAKTRALNHSELDNLVFLRDPDNLEWRDYKFFALPPDQRPKKDVARVADAGNPSAPAGRTTSDVARVADAGNPSAPAGRTTSKEGPPAPRPEPNEAESRPQGEERGSTTTEAQIRANRENAQKSTGPKTPEGKARSSLNAITHGLTGRHILTFGEVAEEFNAYRERWMAELAPQGVQEEDLAKQVVEQSWKLRRARRLEPRFTWLYYRKNYLDKVKVDELDAEQRLIFSDNISAQLVDGGFISKLDRHEAHIERLYSKALDRLTKLRAERKGNDECRRANAQKEEKRDAERPRQSIAPLSGATRGADGGDSAKRSQSGAETPAAPGQAELFRARAAEEAAKFGSAISGEQEGTCGRGSAKLDAEPPDVARRRAEDEAVESEGDFAKRSQFEDVTARHQAESVLRRAHKSPS
jgi:hypothetical protein